LHTFIKGEEGREQTSIRHLSSADGKRPMINIVDFN